MQDSDEDAQKRYLEVGKSSQYERRGVELQHEEVGGVVDVDEMVSHSHAIHLHTGLPQQPCTASTAPGQQPLRHSTFSTHFTRACGSLA